MLLHNLARIRDMLRTYYHSQKALLSPIRHLPPELLSEIFLLSLTFRSKSGAVFPKRKDVLLPGQICRHWRDVAISTSRLWSTLKFDLRMQYVDMEIEMGQTWLARSGSVTLTLALQSYRETPQTHPITDMVLAHTPRIYCLYFKAPLAILHSLRGAMGQIPCLHRLIIDCRDGDPSPIPQSLDTFKIAPKLCYLELKTRVSVQIPNIPWVQLLELHLLDFHYSLNDCLPILHSSPNLVSFHIHLADSPHLHGVIVQHSTLRELDVIAEDFTPLFDSLSLPALTSLSCRWCNSWPRDEFLSFLHRSLFSLQVLILDARDDLDDDYADNVLECLQHTPNLLELELLNSSGDIDSFFWEDMAVNRPEALPCLVPKLRRIRVTRFFELEYTPFVDMVESRWRLNSVPSTVHTAVERIQSVEVSLLDHHEEYENYDDCLYRDGEYFDRLRQFSAEGLEVICPDMDPVHSSSNHENFCQGDIDSDGDSPAPESPLLNSA